MNKDYYLINWERYWKSYADLNPDLAKNNIHSKRALYNHYNNRGYNENRLVENSTVEHSFDYPIEEHCYKHRAEEHNNSAIDHYDTKKQDKIILSVNMFKEKI